MNNLNALLGELLGMFIDDGSLAIAILITVAIAAWISIRFENASAAVAIILCLGCVAALVENVMRSARKANR